MCKAKVVTKVYGQSFGFNLLPFFVSFFLWRGPSYTAQGQLTRIISTTRQRRGADDDETGLIGALGDREKVESKTHRRQDFV